jgi:hypothetical protein
MYGKAFYVFQHPSDSELWIALCNNSASQADNELEKVVEAMLSSLRFVE